MAGARVEAKIRGKDGAENQYSGSSCFPYKIGKKPLRCTHTYELMVIKASHTF